MYARVRSLSLSKRSQSKFPPNAFIQDQIKQKEVEIMHH